MRRPKMIPESRRWYRMYSQWAYITAGALQGAWAMLDGAQKAVLPDWAVTVTTIVILMLGFYGRLIHQPRVRDDRVDQKNTGRHIR